MNGSPLLFVTVLGGAIAGMSCLALAMARHYERLYREPMPDSAARMLRMCGVACLLAIAWPCTTGWGPSIAAVVWTGSTCIAALLVTGALTWLPHFLPISGMASALLASISWLSLHWLDG